GCSGASLRDQALQIPERRAIDPRALGQAHRRAEFWIEHPPRNLQNRVGLLRQPACVREYRIYSLCVMCQNVTIVPAVPWVTESSQLGSGAMGFLSMAW